MTNHQKVLSFMAKFSDKEFLSLAREGIILWDKTVEGSGIY
jgi:hypothetical protein